MRLAAEPWQPVWQGTYLPPRHAGHRRPDPPAAVTRPRPDFSPAEHCGSVHLGSHAPARDHEQASACARSGSVSLLEPSTKSTADRRPRDADLLSGRAHRERRWMSAAAARTNWAFPEPRRPSGSTGVSSRPVRIPLPHPSARGLTAHRRDAVAVGTCSRGRPSRPVRHRSLPRAERRRRVGGRAARSARARSALRDRGGEGLRVRGGQEPVLDPDPTPDQQLAEPDDAGSPWFAVTSSGSCSSRPPAPVVGGDPGRLPPSAQRDGNAKAWRTPPAALRRTARPRASG
jgi:hypothetical protein